MVNWSTIKEERLYNGGKTVSSINGAGKTGQLCAKKKKKTKWEYNTIHKSKFKMD